MAPNLSNPRRANLGAASKDNSSNTRLFHESTDLKDDTTEKANDDYNMRDLKLKIADDSEQRKAWFSASAWKDYRRTYKGSFPSLMKCLSQTLL